jgi:glycosyltransferase involved in cell wall biosynthesis
MPVISVVIPAFNRERTIERAVESVLAQSFQDFEIIVVDDASTDATVRVTAGLSQRDPRITLIRQPQNRGAQAARNAGILRAQGEWIAFLDSDDMLIEDSLSLRLEAAKRDNVSVVHSDCIEMRDDGEKVKGIRPLAGWVWADILSAATTLFPAILVRKTALQQIGLLDESILAYQEWDTSIRLARHFAFAFARKPSFYYDCRGGDTISKDSPKNTVGYEQVVRKHGWDMLRIAGAGALAQHYKSLARRFQNIKNRKKAVYYLGLVMLLQPSLENVRMLRWALRQ